ncbi:hypothetical protein [Larkinella sp.]|uniref:hypothetical protein n=1 Tax=Larkinella sp. TaxID=2034517 RepID=UPI003BABEB29
MNKIPLLFSVFILIAYTSLAQAPSTTSDNSSQVGVLAKKLDHFQKENQRLSRYSKKLKYRVSSVSTLNKKLTIRVEKLQIDSMQLSVKLTEALTNNQKLIQSYEARVKGMSGELQALHDTLSTYKVVKNDLEIIKSYISTLSLAPREYRQPYSRVLKILLESFSKSPSPYEVKRNSEQGMTLLEKYTEKKKVFFFLNKTVNLQATYLLTFNPNPVNDTKTLVKLRTVIQKIKGSDAIEVEDSKEESKAENRLFSYMDKVIVQYN